MLANLAAYDFGYTSARQLIDRTTKTFATMGRLERHRGHIYNWYDTRTLSPLAPLYVSSVDSGNLGGHLFTLSPGLLGLADMKIVPPRTFEGLTDTLRVLLDVARGRFVHPEGPPPTTTPPETVIHLEQLEEELQVPSRTLAASQIYLERLATAGADLAVTLSSGSDDEVKCWAQAFERQCRDFLNDLRQCRHVRPPSPACAAAP